jgi:exopolysaccharide biosynthesis polyprenyl glycosylphosphotransferase
VTVFLVGAASYGLYLGLDIGRSHYEPEFYEGLHLALAAVIVFALYGRGAYRSQLGLLRIEAVRHALSAVFVGIALLLSLSFFLKLPGFSRLWVLVFAPMTAAGLVVQRTALTALQSELRRRFGRDLPVLVYGAGDTGRVLAQHLLEEKALGYRAAAFLDDDPELHGSEVRIGAGLKGEKIPVLGGEAEVERALRETGAVAVFLAMPSAPPARIAELAAKLEKKGISVFFVPSAGELLLATLRFGQVGGVPVFTRRRVQADPLYEISKRLLDLLLATVALLLTAPILAVAAALVKLSSPGPVIFRQTRIGRYGKPFTVYKLRTMHAHAPAYALHPTDRGDPRITKVGRWLRRASIDELPQLVNVLRGDMSLVGPRPEMPFVVAQYDDIQRQRLTVPPGITGLWQISADRAFRIHDNMQYDLYYVENRSLSLDLAILMLTPFVLFGREEAF